MSVVDDSSNMSEWHWIMRQCPNINFIFDFTEQVECGMFGCVFSYPKQLAQKIRSDFGSENVVLKLTRERGSFWKKEDDLSQIMSEIGVGPKVYKTYRCKPENDSKRGFIYAIVMERLDMTMEDYIEMYQERRKQNRALDRRNNEFIIQRLFEKLQRTHDAGFVLGEWHAANIMIQFDKRNKNVVHDVFRVDFDRNQQRTKKDEDYEYEQMKEYAELLDVQL